MTGITEEQLAEWAATLKERGRYHLRLDRANAIDRDHWRVVVPALLAEVRRLRAENDQIRMELAKDTRAKEYIIHKSYNPQARKL